MAAPKLSRAFMDTCYGFERLRGFKGCCGCIDGSFIKIRAPWQQSSNPFAWNSYKKFFAVQLLAVCNASKVFTFVHYGKPGDRYATTVTQLLHDRYASVTHPLRNPVTRLRRIRTYVRTAIGSYADMSILRLTSLWKHWDQYFPAASDERRDPASARFYSKWFYIFGDNGFKLLTWLMTPFTKKQETAVASRQSRKVYSADQKSTRATGENAFGLFKGRWRCLQLGLHCKLKHVTAVVRSPCCRVGALGIATVPKYTVYPTLTHNSHVTLPLGQSVHCAAQRVHRERRYLERLRGGPRPRHRPHDQWRA